MKNGDMPANPCGVESDCYQPGQIPRFDGLTKHEQFAAMAMQGLCVNSGRNGFNNPSDIASQSVKIADALLDALENQDWEAQS